MPFGTFTEAPKRPNLACLGVVKAVSIRELKRGNDKTLEDGTTRKSPYYVLPIEIEAHGAGRNAKFRLLFAPEWLDANFDPRVLANGSAEQQKQYIVYNNNIAGKPNKKTGEGRAALQVLAGDKFAAIVAGVEAAEGGLAPEKFAELVAVSITGRAVGYVLKQGKDEDGDATEFYEVQKFFQPTPANIAFYEKKASDALKVTWR